MGINESIAASFNSLGLTMLILPVAMLAFAAIPYILLNLIGIRSSVNSKIAGFCSLLGFAVWFKYFLL